MSAEPENNVNSSVYDPVSDTLPPEERAEDRAASRSVTPESTQQRRRFAERLREARLGPKRFINVRDGEKASTDHTQYQPENPALSGNYGVYAGAGGLENTDAPYLVDVDVDDYDGSANTEAIDALGETFTVESPHTSPDSPGHRYYAVTGDVVTAMQELNDGKANVSPAWGEIRVENQYVVGPGSQLDGCDKSWCDDCGKPDGGYYRIADDHPIATITADDLAEAICKSDPAYPKTKTSVPVENTTTGAGHTGPVDGDGSGTPPTDVLTRNGWIGVYLAGCDDDADRSTKDLAVCQTLYANGVSESDAHELLNGSPHTKVSDRGMNYWRGTWDEAARRESDKADAKAAERHADLEAGEDDGWRTVRDFLAASEKGTTGLGLQKASELLRDEFNFLTTRDDGTLWYYDGETGVYRPDGETWVQERLAKKLGSEVSTHRVKEVQSLIRWLTYVDRADLGGPEGKLCVGNGVLDLNDLLALVEDDGLTPIEAARNLTLYPHSPEHRFLSNVTVDYDRDAYGDQHPGWGRWVRYIGERVDPRDIPNTQEYVGYCLHNGLPFKKVLLALGPTDSGKSTFLSVVGRLFPDHAVSSEPVQDLTNNQFSCANLFGRSVNIAGDLGTRKLQDLERFKTVTGGEERMKGEEKGKQAFTFKSNAKHLYAANQAPDVNGIDDAFINRWVFAEFPDTVENPDDRVKEELLMNETLRAVLLWGLAGYAKLFGADGSRRGFTAERSIDAKRAMWDKHGDTVDQFIVRCLDTTGNTDDAVVGGDVYEAYREFCHDKGKKPEKQGPFGTTVLAQAPVWGGQRRIDSTFADTSRPRCYIGVRFTDIGEQYRAIAAGEIDRDTLTGDTDDDAERWKDRR